MKTFIVPIELQRTAPTGYTYVHLAWFHRQHGHWLREWAGYVPAPQIDSVVVGDERLQALNAWQQQVQAMILCGECQNVDAEVDADAWDACPSGGAVCLDVTRFGWPVGDHIWHYWNEAHRMLDWGQEHTFIDISLDTLEVVGNQRSHRPIRDSVPGQRVIDITGTCLEPFYGHIFGRFVRRVDRWGFEPRVVWRAGAIDDLRTAPAAVRRQLAEAPVDWVRVALTRETVPVGVR